MNTASRGFATISVILKESPKPLSGLAPVMGALRACAVSAIHRPEDVAKRDDGRRCPCIDRNLHYSAHAVHPAVNAQRRQIRASLGEADVGSARVGLHRRGE